MVQSEYMTIKETAVYLNVNVSTMYCLVKAHDFPAIKPEGMPWRISKKRLEAWVENQLKWKSYGVV